MVVELAPLLEALLALLEFFVALGAIMLVIYIVYGLVKIIDATVGHIPFVGGALSGLAHQLYSYVVEALAPVVQTLDYDISFWWHALGVIVGDIGHAIEEFGTYAVAVASLLSGAPNARAQGWITAAIHLALRPVEAAVHAVERRVSSLEHRIAQSVVAGVYPRIRNIEHEISKEINPDIRALRDATKAAENEAVKAYNYAKAHSVAAADTAFVGAVAVALGKLGFGWLRCESNPFQGNTKACGLWSDLEGLLAAAAAIGLTFDFQQLYNLSHALAAEGEALIKQVK